MPIMSIRIGAQIKWVSKHYSRCCLSFKTQIKLSSFGILWTKYLGQKEVYVAFLDKRKNALFVVDRESCLKFFEIIHRQTVIFNNLH